MDKPLVTFVVPVYNTEKYVENCLKSLISLLGNIEILCVDDGSEDHSIDICEIYKKDDSRIRIIKQENSGVSMARNKGIKESKGEWIFFVDSDDIVLRDIETVIKLLSYEDSDIVFCDAVWGDNNNKESRDRFYYATDRNILLSRMMQSMSLEDDCNCALRSPCFKAYRNSFLEDNNISFPNGVIIGEDFLFNLAAVGSANKMHHVPIEVYKVTERQGSATHSYVADICEKEDLFQRLLHDEMVRVGIFEELKDLYYSEVKSGFMRCLRKKVFHKDNRMKNSEIKDLLRIIVNDDRYKEAFKHKDKNFKREMVIIMAKQMWVIPLKVIISKL